MSVNEIAFLALCVGSLTLLGAALAWANWMENRSRRQRADQ